MADDLTLTVGSVARIKTISERDEIQETFNVRVLNVYRYIVDKSFPIPSAGLTDAFDILITDGRYKRKCLLLPDLNFLVYEHKLRANAIISITQCRSLIHEESLEQESLVILQGIEVLSSAPGNTAETDGQPDLEFCSSSTANEKRESPLAAFRGYYLPLWNDEDYFGSKWSTNPDLKLSKPVPIAITILDLETHWQALALKSRPFPALIGRIVSKTRLNHYGKSSDKKRTHPYQFCLELEDRTASASVCVWESLCLVLYNYLQVGDVVAISNYRVTKKFGRIRSNAVFSTSDAAAIEVSLNPNPVVKVYTISPQDISPLLQLPSVLYRFIDSQSLASYATGTICDVVGTVIFVSREIRERKGCSTSCWTSKWVHLKDRSSSLPIVVQIYSCSQPDVFNNIASGNILVCARMLLKIESRHSQHPKMCFLTTTRESQLYIVKKPSDASNKPFMASPEVADAIRWRQSYEAKRLLMTSCSGGYYNFPPLDHSLELYKREFPQGTEFPLMTTVNLGFVLKELHYMERKRLHIQGTIVALEFVPMVAASTCDETPEESTSQRSATDDDNSSSQHSSQSDSRSQRNVEESVSDSEDDSATGRRGAVRSLTTDHNYVIRRINPKRKCKKVYQTSKGKSRREEKIPLLRKRKRKKLISHLPEKVDKNDNPAPKKALDMKTEKHVQTRNGDQSRSETISTTLSKSGKHFPFRILDDRDLHNTSDTPDLGLSRPSCHENTFPRLCSQELSGVRVVPTADRQGFVNSKGFWRLVIMGLNRQRIINAIFMPETPEETEESKEEPKDGVFISALATGAFSSWYPVETILDRASEELRERRIVFVLDVYSHGESKVEIIINRAFNLGKIVV